jgi:hypothetical protein
VFEDGGAGHLGRHPPRWASRTLSLDAFARCWVQEDLLLQKLGPLLEERKRPLFAQLQELWRRRNRADEYMGTLVNAYLASGDGSELVPTSIWCLQDGERFRPFRVSRELMSRVSKPRGTVFMHDLPAVRGEDVDDEVLDGPESLAWVQAQHKLFSAMSVLEWCGAGVVEDQG